LSRSLDFLEVDQMSNSTFTCPVATRLRPMEYEALKGLASSQGTNVSALLARLARRELQAA